MKTRIQMELRLPVRIKKRGKLFVSSCPILDVWSQGETQEKARKNIVEALTAFVIGCIELGTLEEVLRSCGFTRATPTKSIIDKADYVRIPLHLLSEASGARRCHA